MYVNNYAVDTATDTITDTPELTFAVQAPDWLDGCSAVNASVLTPDPPAPAVQAAISSPGVVEITLGAVHRYASVVLERPLLPDSDVDGVGDACDSCLATWPPVPVDAGGCPLVAPVDFDEDGDVDLQDFAYLQVCLTPLLELPAPGCEDADITADGYVDHRDMSAFIFCLSGTNKKAEVHCAGGFPPP